MLLRMRTTYSGPSGVAQPGTTIEVSSEEAAQLLDGGYAEEVKTPATELPADTTIEEAVAPEKETAATRDKATKPGTVTRGKKPAKHTEE